jgi:hypothetical protein
MTFKTHYGRLLSFAALAATLAAAGAGCGGGSTNGDALGVTPSSYPYIYAYSDNSSTGATDYANEVSALEVGSATQPTSTDVLYFTYAVSNSLPGSTLTGAGSYQTGLADGNTQNGDGSNGTFVAGTSVVPAVAPGGSYLFRAQGVQGQVGHTVENVTAATITPPGGATESFTFALNTAAATPPAGPFIASGYVAPVTIPASDANKVVTFPTTITDAAGHSTTTTFAAPVLAAGFAAIASANTIALMGATPTLTYGPDASGTTILIVPVSKTPYTVNVTSSATGSPVTTPVMVTVASGTVSVE